ncbi:glycosyltransferase family 4 protein [Sphingomonas sp. CL5.1]|uniref:glycosyltransferase n=1 Tax=Sphingomonas sp. CL5.1 TaxID=2653203 RepID=UPI001583363A|nr:glycosyltransferase [Sphingomonas sp. CL5.1]QKR99434.1 glycosyltransferase family 4 protein [Sphingomonas sp. CL5.1]
MSERRPVILHLAVDVNTPQRPKTTNAIEWFVRELGDYDNVVIAYQRRERPVSAPVECAAQGFRLFHFPYFGLRLGIGLLPAMRRAAKRTIALLEAQGIRPDLVHAHKFTFEGLAGREIARHFGVPLFVSLRGEVETKVFRMKPTLRPLLRRVAAGAARLYFVSAWFREEFHRYVPAQPDKERNLPNIVRNIAPAIAPQPPGDRFVAILALDTWKRKGVRWLLDGLALARRERPDLKLDLIGGGSAESRAHVERMIAARGLAEAVTLVGPLPNAELLARLPHYRALLLPSLNETFGMVYVEALFAGVPILFTRGTAIDGYLDGLDVGRAVPPRDAKAIAAAILDLDARTVEMRAVIAAAAPRLFATFDPATSLARYNADVRAALGAR